MYAASISSAPQVNEVDRLMLCASAAERPWKNPCPAVVLNTATACPLVICHVMPPDRPHTQEKDEPAGYNYEADPRWTSKPLTPAQVLVSDIRLERWRRDAGPLLETKERFASSIVPNNASITPSASYVRAAEAASNPIEQQRFARLEEEYGWVRYLRLQYHQKYPSDPEDAAKCRWIHCSSKYPEV